jgi:hypothetical protein
MTFTAQITPYTCALACLESFYRDCGESMTQQELLNNYPAQCFVGRLLNGQDISGALKLPEFVELCKHLKLQPVCFLYTDFKSTSSYIQKLKPNQAAIFFIAHFGGGNGPTHAVGFSKFLGGENLEIMNPSNNPPFIPLISHKLSDWQSVVVCITLP